MKLLLSILLTTALVAESYTPGQLPRISETDVDGKLLAYQGNELRLFPARGYGLNLLTMQSATLARAELGLAIGTDVQAWDADLSVIAGLDTSAFGRNWLTNNSATIARGNLDAQQLDSDLTAIAALNTASVGRQFLTNSTLLEARAYLGLAIGTDVQPFDADLSAISAISTTSFGRGLLAESSGTSLRTTIAAQPSSGELSAIAALSTSSYGRSLLTLSSANAARGYLELGITNSPQFAQPYFSSGLDLGHASDTTLARSAAGAVTIEGKEIVTSVASAALSYSGGTNITVTVPIAGAPHVVNSLAVTNAAHITFSGSNVNATGEVLLTVASGTNSLSFAGNVIKPAATSVPISLTTGTWNLEWKQRSIGGTNFTVLNVLQYSTP